MYVLGSKLKEQLNLLKADSNIGPARLIELNTIVFQYDADILRYLNQIENNSKEIDNCINKINSICENYDYDLKLAELQNLKDQSFTRIIRDINTHKVSFNKKLNLILSLFFGFSLGIFIVLVKGNLKSN